MTVSLGMQLMYTKRRSRGWGDKEICSRLVLSAVISPYTCDSENAEDTSTKQTDDFESICTSGKKDWSSSQGGGVLRQRVQVTGL